MAISAQVSLYPLRPERLSPAIQAVSETLTAAGLHPQTGPMSTLMMGEAVPLFAALGAMVITATVPVPRDRMTPAHGHPCGHVSGVAKGCSDGDHGAMAGGPAHAGCGNAFKVRAVQVACHH